MTREKRSLGFLTKWGTKRPVQLKKQARGLKFWRQVEAKLNYPSCKNKGADQLCSYCTADLCLCFRIGKNLVFSWCSSNGNFRVTLLYAFTFCSHSNIYMLMIIWIGNIRITCPYNIYPLIPHFYNEKLGFARVYLSFSFPSQNTAPRF